MIRIELTTDTTNATEAFTQSVTRTIAVDTDANYSPDIVEDILKRATGAWFAQHKTVEGNRD